ncbi:hypothetical protein Btru_047718 [Bulinus truncatus]|nr:hypothetical protein Btru_047718 [Bulinus truncatus]
MPTLGLDGPVCRLQANKIYFVIHCLNPLTTFNFTLGPLGMWWYLSGSALRNRCAAEDAGCATNGVKCAAESVRCAAEIVRCAAVVSWCFLDPKLVRLTVG